MAKETGDFDEFLKKRGLEDKQYVFVRTDDDSEQSESTSSKAESELHFDPIQCFAETVQNLKDQKFCKALLNDKYLKRKRGKEAHFRKYLHPERL